jgi:beta-lactamase class A
MSTPAAATADVLARALGRIAAGVRADWGVYANFLATGEEIAVNADEPMDTMSVIKAPLVLELFRQAEAGEVDLDRRIELAPEHRRFGTGVLSLMADGASFTLADAAAMAIVQSDNAATDLCFEAVGGPAAVDRLAHELELPTLRPMGTAFDWFRALAASMDARLGELSPAELYATGYPPLPPLELTDARAAYHFGGGRPFGLASARDLGRFFELLWRGEAATPAACERTLALLRLQQHRQRIPRYLLGARCAHKTGDFEPFIANDCGVIEPYAAEPVVLVVLNARHRGAWANLEEAVARIAEKVWERAAALGR